MRSLVVLFIAVVMSLTADAQLRVMTFNVQHAYGTDGKRSVLRDTQWIAAQTPDVVVMNEVYQTDLPTYTADLLKTTGVPWNLVYFADYSGKNEGNVIATPLPITSSDTHQYPTTYVGTTNMTMSAIEATINGYCVFGTHLAWNGFNGRKPRAIQISDLLSWLPTFQCGQIVMGDFNAQDSNTEIQPMFQQLIDVWPMAVSLAMAGSYSDNPPVAEIRTRDTRRIDYIFVTTGITVLSANLPDTRNLAVLPIASQMVDTNDDLGVRPSDHNFWTAVVQ